SDAMASAIDADAGAVWKFAARDRGEHAASAARGAVPALHAANRERTCRAFRRDGAGNGREPGAGRLADAGKHGGDREGGGVSGHAAAGRDGQERDYRSGAPAAYLRDIDIARPGL